MVGKDTTLQMGFCLRCPSPALLHLVAEKEGFVEEGCVRPGSKKDWVETVNMYASLMGGEGIGEVDRK